MEKMELLTDRERLVLDAIVRNFILTTNPVASSFIARNSHLAFSAATIRNIMVQLEEKGYIYQPHTSAGRVPTTAGYRLYVDYIMKRSRLSTIEKEKIRQALNTNPGDFENLLRESSRILAHLTHQLGIIVSPHLDEGVFHRMDITRLSSERLLLVISIKSGMVKTIMLEVDSKIPTAQVESLRRVINERLSGLKIKDIRNKFKEIVKDIRNEKSGLIHIFIQSAGQIFNFADETQIFLNGTYNIMRQPEFSNNEKISGVVELLENKQIILHLLKESETAQALDIKIGSEIGEEIMEDCSIISATYKIDQASGRIGIIGPTRMNYSYLVPLVEFTAGLLSKSFDAN